MLKVAVGHAEGLDAAAVLAEVLAQVRAQLGGVPASAAMLAVSGDFDPGALADGLARALPGVPWIGTTDSGDLSSVLGVSEDAVTLLVLASDTISFSAGLGERASLDPRAAAAAALASAAAGARGQPRLGLVLPDSRHAGTEALLAAFDELLPPGCALLGGKLGGQWDAPAAPRAQFFAGRVVHDAVPLLLLSGPVGHAVRVIQGWSPVGPRQLVGAAEGTCVREIGGRTALEFYRHYLGEHASPIPEFPLAVHAGDEGFCIRTPHRADLETGAVHFSAEVPQGAEVQLAEAIRERLLAETERGLAGLGAEATGGSLEPAAVIVFSCGARKQILGTRTPVEVDLIRRELPGVPVFGFYSGGEVAPLVPGGKARLHNATMVTLVLGTCPGDPVEKVSPPPPPPPPADPALLARRLRRAESYRARAEEAKERGTAMLRTIGAEIEAARARVTELYGALEDEKHKSDRLLQNILPADVAEELKRTGHVEPVYYDSVTVLFTDFTGFTRVASHMSPAALLRELDFHFSAFDEIVERHGLEKLKTIGDAYMCAGGIPAVNATHPVDAVRAAWEIAAFVAGVRDEKLARGETPWELRIGVHTGPLMAGVIGHKKFAYDIWGDTVNVASRLETAGAPGRINISRATFLAVRDRFECEHRGRLAAKNRGEVDMYFVVGPR